MGYWKTKVLPKIKKVFDINGKKTEAAAASKRFDDSKEEINKEFEEKKTELQTKVVEIYEASSTEIKTLVKERKVVGVKKHSAAVNKFLEELEKIEFPGSKQAYEASTKFGPGFVPGPVLFVFEKVCTFVITEEEPTVAVEAAPPTTTEIEETAPTEKKDKEIVVEPSEITTTKEKDIVEKVEESAPPPPPVVQPEVVVAEIIKPAAEPAPVAGEPVKTEAVAAAPKA